MLSVLIEAREEPLLIASTLAALVPGAVEGLVADVSLMDRGMGAEAIRVAEHAGCRVRAEPLEACLSAARTQWVLLLEAGARPMPGWIEEVSGFMADVADGRARGTAARLRIAVQDRPRLVQGLFLRRSLMAGGLILQKSSAVALAPAARGSLSALVKAARPIVLEADMRPRPPEGEPVRR